MRSAAAPRQKERRDFSANPVALFKRVLFKAGFCRFAFIIPPKEFFKLADMKTGASLLRKAANFARQRVAYFSPQKERQIFFNSRPL